VSEPIIAEPRGAYRQLPPMVVDCSVLAAFLFDEPERESAARTLIGKSLFAPWLIDYEMASVGLRKADAGLADIATRALEDFAQLKLIRRSVSSHLVWVLARQEGLSAYDAAYLQLAIELKAPLATYDRTLGAAAERVLSGR